MDSTAQRPPHSVTQAAPITAPRTSAQAVRFGPAAFSPAPSSARPGKRSWTATGAMTAPRSNGQTATRLTGGSVLVVGGLGTNDTSIPTADVYRPTSGEWSATAGMRHRRMGHCATPLANGRVLVTGGLDQQAASWIVHATTEIYNGIVAGWTPGASMSTPRCGHTATRLVSGHVLVVGGFTDVQTIASTELAMPDGSGWAVTTSMAVPRYGHTATRLADGRVLVAGGYDDNGVALDSTEIYDPVADAWSPGGSMGVARTFHAVVTLSSTKILVAGGLNEPYPLQPGFQSLKDAEIYDVAAGSWSPTASMSEARYCHTLTRRQTGAVLVAGGQNGNLPVLQATEIYVPASGTWSAGPPLATPRATHTATLLSNGAILVSGGFAIGQAHHSAELLAA